jgi:hypothetical protein
MRIVNGFTIIATRPIRPAYPQEGSVILGVKDNQYVSGGFEYVTSVMRSLDQSHWDGNGHYLLDLGSAWEDFNTRC